MSKRANRYELNYLRNIESDYAIEHLLLSLNNTILSLPFQDKNWIEGFNYIFTTIDNFQNYDFKNKHKNNIKNIFIKLIIYIFIKNKDKGNIKSNIFIRPKPSNYKKFRNILNIFTENISNILDVDIVIYTENNNVINKCIFLFLKTQKTEREIDIYFWRILLEIASDNNAIKEKYQIEYNPTIKPFVAFATVNFYDEINQPQHRGMFKFFDKSFIAKPINVGFIEPLSHLIDFVNTTL